MTEGVADRALRATPRHATLYRTWSEGGAGLLLTGNFQVDRDDLERPGNVAIDVNDPATTSSEARAALSHWARAGTEAGNHLWMQISHAGRQSPWYVTRRPRGPSAVRLELLGNYCRPVPLTETEILKQVFTPIMGVSILIAVIFSVVNLLVDISYAVLDPRLRFKGR